MAAILGCALKLCPEDVRPMLRGRTYDLKSAYKQFAVHPEDRASLRMGVNVPERDDFAVIGFNSLPFGAIGSVAGFLRVSQALWFIGYFGLGLLWGAFYDVYTLLSRSELARSSSWACESLFNLLGMQYATEGHKCMPFATEFKTLGLEVDIGQFAAGIVKVGHTQSRRTELHEYMSEVLKEDQLSTKDAERLRGRMIFFEGYYTFGRVANTSVKVIAQDQMSKRSSSRAFSELCSICEIGCWRESHPELSGPCTRLGMSSRMELAIKKQRVGLLGESFITLRGAAWSSLERTCHLQFLMTFSPVPRIRYTNWS